jgi:spore coat polysaccharide biosynthesis protein SpsF (cytidylyltransferase family)/phosphoglycolate phosphatase-like HAD superfamily hydrolase
LIPKAIILDFDGVILESISAKGEAFADLFSGHPECIPQIVDLHHQFPGVSRFEKFEIIYRDILKTPLTEAVKAKLGRDYSRCVKHRVIKCPFVKGAREFLSARAADTPLFVASATPQTELEEIIAELDIGGFFVSIFGTPVRKADAAKQILKDHDFSPDDVLMIGDSLADFDGATESGVNFIGRVPAGNLSPFPQDTQSVSDLAELLTDWPEILTQPTAIDEGLYSNLAIVVQARMSSQRLPGKVLMQILDKPMLQYLLERLKQSNQFHDVPIIVATSTAADDLAIEQFCTQYGAVCERGPLNDVVGRFLDVSNKRHLSAFVRISGDSPLIDPELILRGIRLFCEKSCDLVTNVFPRSFPKGQSVEVISVRALKAVYDDMDEQDREHVTPYFYRNADKYRICNFSNDTDLSSIQLSVDTEDDMNFFADIVHSSDRGVPPITLDGILSLGESKGMFH